MFKISPIQSKETQIKYASECGTQYKEGYFAYSMKDAETDELMGFSQFEINGYCGHIEDLLPKKGVNDIEAMFILGRATMNFIDLCGAHTCTARKNASSIQLLHAIGFKAELNDLLYCDMTGMFDGNCDGEVNKI